MVNEVSKKFSKEELLDRAFYRMAWNIEQDSKVYRDSIIVFQTPKVFKIQNDGWYVQVCTPGVQIEAHDVGRIQRVLNHKDFPNTNWNEVIVWP